MVLLPAEKQKTIRFRISAEPGSKVFVAGTFNNWNPKANQLKDNPDSGHFKITLRLLRGRHEYKFIVDEKWIIDPDCPYQFTNSAGSINSVCRV